MRHPRWTMRRPVILMASAALLLGAEDWARGQDALPGSRLSIGRAKEEASFIVVAEVAETGGVVDAGKADDVSGPIMMWTELKPSAVLKGKVSAEELNRRPLQICLRGKERFPKTGEEFIVFIGDASSTAPITKILSKTKENLAAIEAAKPELQTGAADLRSEGGGLGGGGLGGGLGRAGSPLKPATPPSYQGTSIVPDKDATGDGLEVQKTFAVAMARDDPRSEEREAHFTWLDRNAYVRHYDVRRVGWRGHVLGCDSRPGGGWLVKVAVTPELRPQFSMRFCFVLDTVEETYEFVGDRVRMVESNAAIAKPDRHFFPIAW
ncbi:hypothetical protein [Paludisphaera borealis]|uniref:Uncharacterized protein n=1 Tax=Paludisphaera borealis TaxID=1387353 RepID=A0A1U7CSN1_9BACT|nr:hypothetical protein [Paludisphaera borealis]APW61947.1 hypothetical protein BSF38_03479 [Paludisphaera borealis]